MKSVNIAYSCDENYVQHTGISILSLLENNIELDNINIYFIYKDISNNSLDILLKLVTSYNRNFYPIPFESICYDLEIKNTGRHIETVYTKLFFSRISNIEKILYIDSDTVIIDSIWEFYNTELGNNLIGGVETLSVERKNELGLRRSDRFINDGVVLMNLRAIKEENYLIKFQECIKEYAGHPPVLSEGVINKVCRNRILVCNPRFNLMSGLIHFKSKLFLDVTDYYSRKEIREAVKNPVIIHYLTGFYGRPWSVFSRHPMKHYYLYYKSKSFWRDLPLSIDKLNFRYKLIKFLFDLFPHEVLNFGRLLKRKILAIISN